MKLRKYFLMLFVGSLITVALLEISLRTLKFQLAPLISTSHQPCLYVEDDRYGYRYEPNKSDGIFRYFEMDNLVTTNSAGFHDVEHELEKGSGNSRILVVGDSFTAGLHVPTNNVWTRVLERSLGSQVAESQFEVINLGIDGTGTDIHKLVLEDYLPIYEPDIVIVAFYENDIAIVRWLFDNVYAFRLPVIAIKRSGRRVAPLFLLDSNYIYPSAIGVRRWHWGNLPHNIDDRLNEIKDLSEKFDFQLFVIPVPTKNSMTESLGILRNAASSDVLGNIHVVEIEPYLEQVLQADNKQFADLFWRYDGHFNSTGNEYFGKAVSRALQQRISDGSMDSDRD